MNGFVHLKKYSFTQIASALVLVQHTEVTCPKVKDFRALYAKVISDKHEDVMAKFGAILAQGIIDAGGRNATVSLQSRTGHTNMIAVVGMQVVMNARRNEESFARY